MAAAESTQTILMRGVVTDGSGSRHPVVDRDTAAEHDVAQGRRGRHVAPQSPIGEGIVGGAVELRVMVRALAEEEGVTGAVGDISDANDAVDAKEAIPGEVGIYRSRSRGERALAGIAAVTSTVSQEWLARRDFP